MWVGLLMGPVRRIEPVAFDTFRDAAAARHMLEGDPWADPTLARYPYWYAPIGPAMYAAISRPSNIPPLTLYAYSILWFNVWLPVLLYVLMRAAWGRPTALAAVVTVWLGSRWWNSHALAPIASIQGIVPLFVALIAWQWMRSRSAWWSVAVGLLLALCTWHHVLCGIVGAGAIGFDGLWSTLRDKRRGGGGVPARAVVAGAVCGVLVAPLALRLASLPVRNDAPIRYLARELDDVRFALHAETPLVLPLAAVGLWTIAARRDPAGGWVIGYLLIGLLGQLPAYVRGIPVRLIPHEFQWHCQIAVCILAVVGAKCVGERLGGWIGARRPRLVTVRSLPTILWTTILVVTLLPGAAGTLTAGRLLEEWTSTRASPEMADAMDWLTAHSSVNDVVLTDVDTGYFVVAPRTGRKLVYAPPGHMNPAAPAADIRDDYRTMLRTDDEVIFRTLLDEYRVRFAVVSGDLLDRAPQWVEWGAFTPAWRRDGVAILLADAHAQ